MFRFFSGFVPAGFTPKLDTGCDTWFHIRVAESLQRTTEKVTKALKGGKPL